MKKLLTLALIVLAGMVYAAEVGGTVSGYYGMNTPNDDLVEPESGFGTISVKLWVTEELGEGLNGKIKVDAVEVDGGGTAGDDVIGGYDDISLEEAWISKDMPFGVENLGIKFGKMEVPFNLDYDKTGNIVHSMTNGGTLGGGIGEIDRVWGFNVNYGLGEGLGTINLTTFEAASGLNTATSEDADSGMFQSMALNWDTGADAFQVAGLRLVIGYANIAKEIADETGTMISLGSTYTLADIGLVIGLEINMSTWMANGEDGSMMIALDVDYAIDDTFGVGLSYEQLDYTDNDLYGADTRMAVRGLAKVSDKVDVQLVYETISNSEDDDAYGNTIYLGVVGSL